MDRLNQNSYIVKHSVIAFTVLLLAAVFTCVPTSYGQKPGKVEILRHVPFKTVSAEIIRFEKPVQLGVGKRLIKYREALVLRIDINQKDYEALPPSIAPYLYIGHREYRIFHVGRAKDKEMLTLTFHIRDWEEVPDNSPMVFTIIHNAPELMPKLFTRDNVSRYTKSIVIDKRQ